MEWILKALEHGGLAVAVVSMAIGIAALWVKLGKTEKEAADERAVMASEREAILERSVKEQKELQEARIAETESGSRDCATCMASMTSEREAIRERFAKEQKELQEARISELREVLAAVKPVEGLAEQVESLVSRVEQLLSKYRR